MNARLQHMRTVQKQMTEERGRAETERDRELRLRAQAEKSLEETEVRTAGCNFRFAHLK